MNNQSSNSHPAKILVVEDDTSILLGLRMNLEAEGYLVQECRDGRSGLEMATTQYFDLLLLDVMLPKLNGYEILSRLRERGSQIPVLMLSARSGEMDKVMGLDLGAEDYITKPFSVSELMARVRVVLRRAKKDTSQPTWRFGDIVVDQATRQVSKSGNIVDLTSTEFDVLKTFLFAAGRVLTRDQVFEAVWGGQHGTRRTVDNFVAQLRSKLEDDPANPLHLITVRGVGYRLQC